VFVSIIVSLFILVDVGAVATREAARLGVQVPRVVVLLAVRPELFARPFVQICTKVGGLR
jgi:hypothetical protein